MSQEKILLELEALSKNRTKSSTRHDLMSKLETLEAFGCTMDQIQESPEILQLGLTEIVKRASSLKYLGHTNISVQLLKAIHSNMSLTLMKQKLRLLRPMFKYTTLISYMQEVLKCSDSEMHILMQKVPAMRGFRNMNAFTAKVEYLQSQGLTLEDFKAYPAVLCRSLTVLRDRTSIIKKFQVEKSFPIGALIVSEKQFQRFLRKYHDDQEVLKGHHDRNDCIAKMFGVSEMIQSQMQYFHNRRLATVKPRIDYLISVGVSLEDIRNHLYILRYKIETLKRAFAQSQEAGIQSPSVLHLTHIILLGRVPLKPPHPKSANYLPELIGYIPKDMKNKYQHLRSIMMCNRWVLKENLDFLLSEGFTADQIYTCPLILSHKREELKASLEKLPLRPEMQNNLDMLQDGTMKINLIQYFLEKESNFRLSSVEVL